LAKHILLVEPDYYTQYPPIGLFKLSTYHKEKGNTTELLKGCNYPKKQPDVTYITSLFTWAWKPVWKAVSYYKSWFPEAEVWLGGLYASLMPDHAELSGADHIFNGVFREAEDLMPDYSLDPKWDGSIVFSSRGCDRKCGFCAVPILEGKINSTRSSIKQFLWPTHTRIIFFDNNILANPYWRDILDELYELKKRVDFNQGLDARFITEEVAEKLTRLELDSCIRIAYDMRGMRGHVKKAIDNLAAVGIKKRRILVYALFNYNDTPDNFFERVRDILNWGVVCYPMRYEPIRALEKNIHISPTWDKERLEAVQKARRVIGYGGAFPPYDGLKKKFNLAGNFDEAFELRKPKGGK